MRRIAAAWESGDGLTDAETREALGHASSCDVCRSKYPVFLALAPRDSGPARRAEPSGEARSLAERVMADIGTAPRARPVRTSGSRLRRRLPYAVPAALVACALFIVGLRVRESDTVEIRFVLDAPNAKTVFLAGDFSSWDTKNLELNKTASGIWERKVRLRRGQAYSYNFIVDGDSWVVDPAAPERIEDGFGGESALIRL